MAVAVNTLGDRVRRLARDYPAVDTISAQISNVATTVGVGNGQNFSVGRPIVIDQEMLWVTAITANTATVVRGWQGTTAATHVINSVVLNNPRFAPSDILDALNEGLRQLYPYWFSWVEDESISTTSDLQADYALPAAFGESGMVTAMEVLFPGLTNDGWRGFRWFRHIEGVTARTISLIRIPPVNSKLRLIGIAPFTTDLAWGGNTPSGLIDAGITGIAMYAQHYLALQDEARRQVTTTAKNVGPAAFQAGMALQRADYLFKRFQAYCATHGQRLPMWRTRRRI